MQLITFRYIEKTRQECIMLSIAWVTIVHLDVEQSLKMNIKPQETKQIREQELHQCPKCQKRLTKKDINLFHECTKNDTAKALNESEDANVF